MCIAAPARVLARDGGAAVVDVAGRTRRASLLLMPEVEVGAWVLVAAGTVVREITAGEAAALASELEAALAAAPGLPRPAAPSTPAAGGSR